MRVHHLAVLLTVGIAACTDDKLGPGSVQLVLELPPKGDLRPEGMTTVAVGVTQADGTESVLTTPLEGAAFTAGDVGIGEPVLLDVELRDNTNRLVGFGRVDDAVVPDDTAMTVTIPVRKPYVYVASGGLVRTIDSTVDAANAMYQGSLAMAPASTLVVPIDGTELAVFTAAGLQRVTTADHKPAGSVIAISGAVLDAVAVPGARKVVVATAAGLSVVDIDAGSVDEHPLTQRPDRVAIGGNQADGYVAFVLSGRVAPPTGTAGCAGASTVFAVPLAPGSEISPTISTGTPIADIAASGTAVYGANPCGGTVKRLDAGAPALSMTLAGAGALALLDGRLYATGSTRSATDGARITLSSVQLDGSSMRAVNLPPKAEVMTYDNDSQHELAIDMHADTEVALDFAVLPGAQYVALIARMDSHRNPRSDSFGEVIPQMDVTVHDVVIADTQTGGVVQRIRAQCDLTVTSNNAEFPFWSCITATGAEVPAGGETVPTAIDALYGAR